MVRADSTVKKWSVAKRDSLFTLVTNIRDKFTHYSMDSISFKTKTDTTYDNLLSNISNQTKNELENVGYKTNKIIFDGVQFAFSITSKHGMVRAQADTPNEKSYPILYKFIEATINEYRNRKNNELLNRKRMFNY